MSGLGKVVADVQTLWSSSICFLDSSGIWLVVSVGFHSF